MNNVILMGRLTADPELRTTNNGLNYCRFTVAVDRYSKGEDKKTDFINCVAWRQSAVFISRYFTKGQMIAVEGSIQTGSYTNKDGVKVYTTDILVSSVSFTGDRRSEEGQGNTNTTPAEKTLTAPHKDGKELSADIDPDEDLPF